MLVCTSIIESGIDIPQANTLIVERADMFGLAQLYQIRGRVGRSRERAYAYLLYPSAAALTADAAQRLSALSDYTELGAGFKIAMRDLEIRGAGNLLGDEQSGHVAALGFELYMQMLDEAVERAAEDGDGARGGLGAGAPRRQRRRLRARRLHPLRAGQGRRAPPDRRRARGRRPDASCASELEDRFGELPEPLENLIALQTGADQARSGRRAGGHVPRRPAGGHADRARLACAPSGSAQEIPEALYESGKSQLSMRVPEDPVKRFPAVVRAADVLLAVTREARAADSDPVRTRI